jgi:hypothetical protein
MGEESNVSVTDPSGFPLATPLVRYCWPRELPKCSPNGVLPVKVALLATLKLEFVDVILISGNSVPDKTAAPEDGGVFNVQAAYTPVPLTALDMGINAKVAVAVVATAVAITSGSRNFMIK